MLTAGGDCPGLNAVIRGATRRLLEEGHEAVGLRRGYEGLAEPSLRMPLGRREVTGILQLGGTILSTSSFDPWMEPDGVERVKRAQESDPLDAVIAIGGEHTMMITRRLHEELGIDVVGVPKTIDNDVTCTDFTFGFDTAVQTATDAIDRLRTTAQSHDRIMVVEVMGRNVGWIATFAGIAGGADAIVIPELTMTVEEMCRFVTRRHERGKNFSIIVVSEGAELAFESGERRVIGSTQTDDYGYPMLGGIGQALAKELQARTGYDTRVTTLGHIQRGGSPTSTDRILGTRYGVQAANMVLTGQVGRMAALHGHEMTSVPLEDVEGVKTVDLRYLELARTFYT
jgi:ATP-dependent phosphofructokinase / diphosphate-dependent phosphofructokinase